MEIEKPIFIVGSGRSGTTILYNCLSVCPEVCWFSNLTARYPRLSKLAVLHRVLEVPFVGDKVKKGIIRSSRFTIRPSEGGKIYHAYCGFEHARKTTEDDLSEGMECRLKGIIREHLRLTGKSRFLNKQTSNTQRIGLMNRMFPDAYYVHLLRDGRAVANSLFRVAWWSDVDIWWLGYRPPRWKEMGREPIELCALHWRRDVEEILQNKRLFGDRYIEVRYEELVRDTRGVISTIADCCGLNGQEEFHTFLPGTLPNMNYKWERELTAHQKSILNDSIGEFLVQLGYS
jgi:hypothetical protein